MSESVNAETYAQILETIVKRIRSGEIVITNFSQTRDYERWWHRDKCEYFAKDMTMSFSYHDPEYRLKEQERKKAYLESRPRASLEDTWAVVALNGIPRGVCYDWSVEEGWVEYLVPKSGRQEDYSDPNAELELRRYHGDVKVLGHVDPHDKTNESLHKFYENLPPETTMFPTENYVVMPWDPPPKLGKTLSGS